MNSLINGEYAELLASVREKIHSAQYAALRQVNQEMIALYWDIGRILSERQQAACMDKASFSN